jgi:glycosyltransferase involved in cell wall biosynthesis
VRLVRAFARAADELPAQIQLVLTGRAFPKDHPAALLIEELGLGRRIVHLGYRSAAEMGALFHECEALLYPSLFEGFGMPVAEAIIVGKPVACSNTTSLPEIAGDAALMFDPESVEGIADAIIQIVLDIQLRQALCSRAARRRALFEPARSAIRTLGAYRRALEH